MKIFTTTGSLAVITPCYNDFDALQVTLCSLQSQLRQDDEFILVDSSTDQTIAPYMLAKAGLLCRQHCVWSPPNGVYPAQNLGLKESTAPWVQIINSGDRLLPGARCAIQRAIDSEQTVEIHVFLQSSSRSTGPVCVFRPNDRGVWPHQSIITARSVHDRLGFYNERYRLAADQIFFAQARQTCHWQVHDIILTHYDLAGLSSVVSWATSIEAYAMWRALGRSPILCAIKSFLLPTIRSVLQKAAGVDRANSIKFWLFPRYKTIGQNAENAEQTMRSQK